MSKAYKDLKSWIEDGNENVFDTHIAKRIDLPTDKNDCFIHFQSPNTSDGWMDFIYCNGTLTIQGDYGNCSLCWHNNNNTIENISKFASNMGYFLSKLESSEPCSIPNKHMMEFDSEVCIKEVQEYIKENELKISDDFEYWENETEHHNRWVTFCQKHGKEFFNDYDFWEYAFDFGQYLNGRTYLWCYGLIKAIEYLEKAK